MFMVTGLIQGSTLTLAYASGVVKHDTWLVILSGLAVTIPFALIYVSLAKRFPGMNLVQIHDVIYGRYIGKAISTLYFIYFLMVLSFNIRVLGDFYSTFFMPETPLIFFLVVITLVCAYAVRNGIEVLARISPLFVAIVFLIIISAFLLLLKDMNFANFLPVFELPLSKFIQGTHIIAAIPLGEVFLFLTVMAAMNDYKHASRSMLLGLLLGAVSLLLIAIRDSAVLGGTEAILISPAFQAFRLIDIGNIFTRMDILIGIGLTIMIFLKSSLFYYAATVSISQLLRLKSYVPLILPVGGITVILAITDWQSSVEAARFAPNAAPIFITPFLFIFPPLSLLIAKVRNLTGHEREKRK